MRSTAGAITFHHAELYTHTAALSSMTRQQGNQTTARLYIQTVQTSDPAYTFDRNASHWLLNSHFSGRSPAGGMHFGVAFYYYSAPFYMEGNEHAKLKT